MSVSSFDAERAKQARAARAQAVAARSTGAFPLQRKSLEEAIAIYRQLAERDPDTYALKLCACLDDLSPCLSLFGEFQAAADAAKHSADLAEQEHLRATAAADAATSASHRADTQADQAATSLVSTATPSPAAFARRRKGNTPACG